MTNEATTKPGQRKGAAGLMLPPPPPVIPTEKLQATVPKALLADLELYREAYQEMHGAPISLDVLLPHVLTAHLRRDKAFAAWAEANQRKLQTI